MDPKATANLDPKLKEAYDRVMSTPVPKPADFSVAQESMHATIPLAPTPQTVSPTPVTPASTPPPQVKQAVSFAVTMPKHSGGGSKMLPILFGLGGLVFFVVYAIFWVKFFGLKVPFLPF